MNARAREADEGATVSQAWRLRATRRGSKSLQGSINALHIFRHTAWGGCGPPTPSPALISEKGFFTSVEMVRALSEKNIKQPNKWKVGILNRLDTTGLAGLAWVHHPHGSAVGQGGARGGHSGAALETPFFPKHARGRCLVRVAGKGCWSAKFKLPVSHKPGHGAHVVLKSVFFQQQWFQK